MKENLIYNVPLLPLVWALLVGLPDLSVPANAEEIAMLSQFSKDGDKIYLAQH